MDYVIGDIQGCYRPLQSLLKKIRYRASQDTLWLCGDLVNRGSDSLSVIRLLSDLDKTNIVLGNHDLHLLAVFYGASPLSTNNDTFVDLLNAPDVNELINWLGVQPILHYDEGLNTVMTHAGIPPCWDLQEAIQAASLFYDTMAFTSKEQFFSSMYGNEPSRWVDAHSKEEQVRFTINALTRMRYCDAHHKLEFKTKTLNSPQGLFPWFQVPNRKSIDATIVFGHWAALNGIVSEPNIHALDTGCVWGGALTALCLQTNKRFHVDGELA